jgi:hypothetical protein
VDNTLAVAEWDDPSLMHHGGLLQTFRTEFAKETLDDERTNKKSGLRNVCSPEIYSCVTHIGISRKQVYV